MTSYKDDPKRFFSVVRVKYIETGLIGKMRDFKYLVPCGYGRRTPR